jgi:hypothetical protein
MAMAASNLRRHSVRILMLFHFIGLAMCLGSIFANVMIERQTRDAGLTVLALGRDLIGLTSRNFIQTGFLMMVATGILIVLLRYGLRAPIWVWIKVATSSAILAIVVLGLDPAALSATQWAHWSAEHGQLAPQFLVSVAQAGRYGVTVVILLLVTTIVAIWKPFSSGLRRRTMRSVEAQQAGAMASTGNQS